MVMPMGGFGMMTSGNMYKSLNERYGYPPVDDKDRPSIGRYPMETVPVTDVQRIQRSWFGRFISKLFS